MNPGELFHEATQHHQAGRLAEAEVAYRRLLSFAPQHPDANHLLGLICAQKEQRGEALALIQRAVGMQPNNPVFRNNLGELFRQLNRLTDADAEFVRAIQLGPNFAEAFYNRGNVLKLLGRQAEAVQHYREAIRLKPHYYRAHYNLANSLREEGLLKSAIAEYRIALSIEPNSRDAHLNLANSLYDLRQLDEAIAEYQRAGELAPADADIEDSLGNAWAAMGRMDEAAAAYRRACQIKPGRWLKELRIAGLAAPIMPSLDFIDEYRDRLNRLLDQLIDRRNTVDPAELHTTGAEPPMLLAYQGRDDRPMKEKYARLFSSALPQFEPPPRGVGPPLVGVVVTHGHEGVFARCLGDLVQRLPSADLRVKLACCRSGVNVIRHMMPNSTFDFFVLPDRIDESAAALRHAQFDLLHYWEIGTDSTNYFLPYFRPARIQTTCWGWPTTTGNPTVNGYVSCERLEPLNGQRHYTEPLIRLPSLPTHYLRPPIPIEPTRFKSRFDFRQDRHLYLCQQNLRKCHPDWDATIAELLNADPKGTVVFISDEQPVITELFRERLRSSIGPVMDRVLIVDRMEREEYLDAVACVDAVLDTPHYGGGANTVYDALAAGTPIVTMPGEFHRGRWASAAVERIGFGRWVAADRAAYVRQAILLAADARVQIELRRDVQRASRVLFEDEAAVEELRAALLKMIR